MAKLTVTVPGWSTWRGQRSSVPPARSTRAGADAWTVSTGGSYQLSAVSCQLSVIGCQRGAKRAGPRTVNNCELRTTSVSDPAGPQKARPGEADAFDRHRLSGRTLGKPRVARHQPPELSVVGAERVLVTGVREGAEARLGAGIAIEADQGSAHPAGNERGRGSEGTRGTSRPAGAGSRRQPDGDRRQGAPRRRPRRGGRGARGAPPPSRAAGSESAGRRPAEGAGATGRGA